jgi:hypothetical protein
MQQQSQKSVQTIRSSMQWLVLSGGNKHTISLLLAKSSEVTDELMSNGEMPLKPQVYQVGDRYKILYRGDVAANNKPLGRVYMAQDVTAEQHQLIAAIQGLTAVCILATLLTSIALAPPAATV